MHINLADAVEGPEQDVQFAGEGDGGGSGRNRGYQL